MMSKWWKYNPLYYQKTNKPNDSNDDVFVHQTGLIDKIRENDKVKYIMERGQKGMNAVNVELLIN